MGCKGLTLPRRDEEDRRREARELRAGEGDLYWAAV